MQVNLDAKFVASFLYASVYIHMKDVAYCKFVSLSDGVFFSCGKIFLVIFSFLVVTLAFASLWTSVSYLHSCIVQSYLQVLVNCLRYYLRRPQTDEDSY